MAKQNRNRQIQTRDLFNGVLHLDTVVPVVQNKQEVFVEHHHVFNAVLLPVVLWLGRDSSAMVHKKSEWIHQDVRDLFGLDIKDDSFLISFFEQESEKMFRFDEQDNHVGYLTSKQYVAIIWEGCIRLKELFPGKTVSEIRSAITDEMAVFKKNVLFSKVGRYLLNGRPDQTWYHSTHTELTQLLPMVKPQVLFHLMAGTSMNAQLKSNIRFFFKALAQYMSSVAKPFYNSAVNEETYTKFSGFLPAAIHQLDYFVEHGMLRGRKISNFAQAMLGNPDAVVVDIWIMRAFGSDRKYVFRNQPEKSRSPEKRLYDAIEFYIQRMARIIGLEPREFCSMIWGGVRVEETGVGNKTRYTPFISEHLHFNDVYIHPEAIHFGQDGIHFGVEATKQYHT